MPVPKCLPLLWSKIEPGVVSGFWAKSQLKKQTKKNINDSEILFIISFPQKFPYLLLVTLHNNRFSNLSKYRLVLKRNHAELVGHQQWHCIMGKRSCSRTLSNHYTCLIACSDARWWFLRYLSHLHPLWSRNSWTHRTDQTSASYWLVCYKRQLAVTYNCVLEHFLHVGRLSCGTATIAVYTWLTSVEKSYLIVKSWQQCQPDTRAEETYARKCV